MAKAAGSTGVQFGSPERKATAARSAGGRTCDHGGCSTVLSTYNSSATCWLHTLPAYRHPLSRT